eukprot:TRINITY_DN13666_c0_g2_i11.p1 TRINITY_DN13666_c0_g2~~TRINITY_DN13666_c0_g2_i11.p1  ORF type:complete len:413 (+),score=106.13 TRINITY_DN13666_c0_g2_i11:1-1239(+)
MMNRGEGKQWYQRRVREHFKFALKPAQQKRGMITGAIGDLTLDTAKIPDTYQQILLISVLESNQHNFLSFLKSFTDTISLLVPHEEKSKIQEGTTVIHRSSSQQFLLNRTSGSSIPTKAPAPPSRPSHAAGSKKGTITEKEISAPLRPAIGPLGNYNQELMEKLKILEFRGIRDEVGSSLTIVHGKFFRITREAPWQYMAIGIGLTEQTLDELTTPQQPLADPLPVVSNPLLSLPPPAPSDPTTPLTPYLSHRWRSVPRNLQIIALEGVDLVAMDDTGKSDPFLEFLPLPKSTFQFPKKQTNYVSQSLQPKWGEAVEFRNVKALSGKDTNIIIICWDWDAVGQADYMGEFRVDVKKYYKESINLGCRCVERWFKLTSSSDAQKMMRKGLSKDGLTYKSAVITGSVKLRFLAF